MRRPSSVSEWLKLGLLLAVPVEVLVILALTRPDEASEPERVLRAGAVSVAYDSAWSRQGERLEHPDGSRLEVLAPSSAGLTGTSPRLVDAGGSPGLAYPAGPNGLAYVFTLADGTRVAVRCHEASATGVCGRLLGEVSVKGAVAPVPSPQVAAALRSGLAAVSGSAAGPQLISDSPSARAGAARGLAKAWRELARTATRQAERQPGDLGRPLAAIARAASRVARDLDALAATTRRRRYSALRTRLRRHERAVALAVDALRAQGYAIAGSGSVAVPHPRPARTADLPAPAPARDEPAPTADATVAPVATPVAQPTAPAPTPSPAPAPSSGPVVVVPAD